MCDVSAMTDMSTPHERTQVDAKFGYDNVEQRFCCMVNGGGFGGGWMCVN